MSGLDFKDHVVKPAREADQYVAEIGGLPEISRASLDLRAAVDKTGLEIDSAQFASRFATEPSEYFRTMTASVTFTADTRRAIDEEGEAGLKRAELSARLMHVGNELTSLIHELVELRADLHISQQEF